MIKKTLKSLKKQIASPDYSSMDLKAVTNSFNRTSDDINSYCSSVDNVMKLLQDGNTDDAQIQMNGVVLQNLMSLSTDKKGVPTNPLRRRWSSCSNVY